MNPAPENLLRAAGWLQTLNTKLIYVGGSVAPLYYQRSEFFGEERPTVDVDCVIEAASYVRLHEITECMRDLGFNEGQEPGDPICRWRGHDLVLDLVPLSEDVLGFSNRWYLAGWETSITVELGQGVDIGILRFGYYIATKLEAFKQRGKDPRLSHDLEDVMLCLAARNDLVQDLVALPSDARTFLAETFRALLRRPHSDDVIVAHVGVFDAERRITRFMNRLIETSHQP
jgi:hypothetical protein